MKLSLRRCLPLCLLVAAFCALPAFAADEAKPAAAKKDAAVLELPPLPEDASVEQSIRLDGRVLKYRATVGSLPVRDEKGVQVADVVYTAYTIADGTNRPVTFALNGGPGASSVYLNFGAFGPKYIPFGRDGESPSDPVQLEDNPGTWLDFTDLVFIDPVGTGFSRALVEDERATKLFYATNADIHYLSRIIYDWLLKNRRMGSLKYLAGESYGGFRGPRIAEYLQTRLGVAMRGVVLVSPYLDPASYGNRFVSPLPWMLTLPSITAANLERQGRLTPEAMHEVIEYTRGPYVQALLQGNADPAARDAMIARVTEMTGLDAAFVRRAGGRIDSYSYLREVHRDSERIGSIYDSNVSAWDPFPWASSQRSGDPMLNAIIAPTTTAMVDFVTRTVGWKADGSYQALNYGVGRLWHQDDDARDGSVEQLHKAVANDPKLQVLIVHGWNDLSCPVMNSVLVVDQMPVMGDASRVRVLGYPGGHMFYNRPGSQAALRADIRAMYERR